MTTDYISPDNVLVVSFGDDPERDTNAYQALTDLKQLDSQGQTHIIGAAVVTRDLDGRVEVKSDVVRCVIEEGPAEDAVEVADGEVAPEAPAGVGSPRFGYDATAVVARATHQRVIAFIPKRDGKTQTVTQTYILDRPRQRF